LKKLLHHHLGHRRSSHLEHRQWPKTFNEILSRDGESGMFMMMMLSNVLKHMMEYLQLSLEDECLVHNLGRGNNWYSDPGFTRSLTLLVDDVH
jgi:hypothetical protein